MPINIGHISYANCTPIFSALTSHFDCSGYRFLRGVPAELNMMLREGKLDVCPSSSIEYTRSSTSYLILPDLSISSVGAVQSVLLFSRRPIEDLKGKAVGLSTESNTSVNLLKILLLRMYGLDNTFHPTSGPLVKSLEAYDAILAIGDQALQGALSSDNTFVYDLGDLWYRFTGLPFVFALWIARADSVHKNRRAFMVLSERLRLAKEMSRDEYGTIASVCSEKSWIDQNQLIDYWRTISYDLTPAHVQGVMEFFRLSAELKLTPAVKEIRFLE